MSVYKDIDLSFSPNFYRDVPVLKDFDDIKNTMLNNLMISSSERPFSNLNLSESLDDYLHTEKSVVNYNKMKEFISSAVRRDSRVSKIKNIEIIDDSDYSISINLFVELNFGTPIETNITLDVRKE